jgi:hypothetical protein|tara:strand:+ start:1220 stop:1723 length:504 start_codon:yes stop_codon:yes gene_type:complete
MNLLLIGTIFIGIFLFIYWFAKTSSKKVSKLIRSLIIILSITFAIILAYGGRFIFSLPFMLIILPLIKTKAGLSLVQLFRIWNLLLILKRSGRFNFGQNSSAKSSSTIPLTEAYKILNLDHNKKYSKEEIKKAHKKIISKVHPDISPETARLASIVNAARDTILKNL